MKIHTNDEVVVTAGKDRGKRGKVMTVITKHDKIIVEGVNIITRHLKRNPNAPQAGGRVERPAPIHISKVALWSEAEGRGVRVKLSGTGRDKHRVSARNGQPVGATHAAGRGAQKKKGK